MKYVEWTGLFVVLVLVGSALDAMAPPISWKNPRLLCPTPGEQFAAQSTDLLEMYPLVTKLGLLEKLEDLERDLHSSSATGVGNEEVITSGQAETDRKKKKKGKKKEIWPNDYNYFWHKLRPDMRKLIGVNVEPKDGLVMPQGIWPIKKQWEHFRMLPLLERLRLLHRLDKFYWLSDEQRHRVFAHYRHWLSLSKSDRKRIQSLFERWKKMSAKEKHELGALYRSRYMKH
ncbi:MAG: DUF3106 domain-containing protein [Deltaproteobacteria bacterium]|nr:DUF3106 domain-containing protein [Deltaproteobacteria bacterium]